MTPEQKMYLMMTGIAPASEVNFSMPQLAHAEASTLQHERHPVFPEPCASVSQLRARGRAPMPFQEPHLEEI